MSPEPDEVYQSEGSWPKPAGPESDLAFIRRIQAQAWGMAPGVRLAAQDVTRLCDLALLAVPQHPKVEGLKGAVLWFGSERDRDSFIGAVHEAMPTLTAVKLP